MSLATLPLELISHVISYLPQTGLAPYATVSRIWQHCIEQVTFEELEVHSDAFEKFENVFLRSQYVHRHRCLKLMRFRPILPDYDDKACTRFERKDDKQANDQAFTSSFEMLFAALSRFERETRSNRLSLMLSIESPRSSSDRGPHRLVEDNLKDNRYKHSSLRLLQTQTIPGLACVNDVSIVGSQFSRHIQPSSALSITRKIIRLEEMNLALDDTEKIFPSRRKKWRLEFAAALASIPTNENLRHFRLSYNHCAPSNNRFRGNDTRGGKADVLSSALHDFIARHKIRFVTLLGDICIDGGFFWPSVPNEPEKYPTPWTDVEDLTVIFSMVRPDGGWYFSAERGFVDSDGEDDGGWDAFDNGRDDGDAGDLDEWSPRPSDDEEHSDSESDYDSDESFFESLGKSDLKPDHFNPEKDERLSGMDVNDGFRTYPNSSSEPLLLSAARRAAFMPHLRHMSVQCEVGKCRRTHECTRYFEFTFISRGVSHCFDPDGAGAVGHNRLYWSVPKGWKMSEDLEQLWRKVIGIDGTVKYDEW